MALKISISGVRGLVPDALTPDVCLNFAKAFGTYLNGGKVVVGTDSRASSEFIKGIVFSGLLSTGCQVVDLGIAPTPTVGIMVRELKADGGLVITASHNPLPWNGLKFMRADGIFLNEAQAHKLITLYSQKQYIPRSPRTITPQRTALDIHLKKILKTVNGLMIRRRKFTVAVDACNGAGSVIALKLLHRLGCKVAAINCDPHKPFPHPPEPVAGNLQDLCQLVKETRADVGFAFDSDADRLAIVSETGEPVGEEATLALAVKFILSKSVLRHPKHKIVITNLSTTNAINDIAKQHQGQVIRTKVGEVHVAEELSKLKGLIGGEGNGGVIYPPVGPNRDALAALALTLYYMAKARKKLSELLRQFPHYYMIKTKYACANNDEADDFLDRTKELFKGKTLVLTEGVKVHLPDGWVHVRPSNTEPIIRIIAEGKTRTAAQRLVDLVCKPFKQHAAGQI